MKWLNSFIKLRYLIKKSSQLDTIKEILNDVMNRPIINIVETSTEEISTVETSTEEKFDSPFDVVDMDNLNKSGTGEIYTILSDSVIDSDGFSFLLGDNIQGLKTRSIIGEYNNEISFRSYIEKDGLRIGTIDRSFEKDRNGNLFVYHDYLFINEKAEVKGFATDYFSRVIPYYQEMGIKYIKTYAMSYHVSDNNDDTKGDLKGALIWAKFGFSNERMNSTIEDFKIYIDKNSYRIAEYYNRVDEIHKNIDVKIVRMKDFIDFKIDNWKAGRDFLENSGASWHGKLDLDPESLDMKELTEYLTSKKNRT